MKCQHSVDVLQSLALLHAYATTCRYTREVARNPCTGLQDMQRAVKGCLHLIGEELPGAEGLPTWPYGEG